MATKYAHRPGTDVLIQFDSVYDVAEFIDNTPRTEGASRSGEAYSASAEWDLDTGYDEAMVMVRKGWDGPRAETMAIAEQITADAYKATAEYQPKLVHDFTGCAVDMGRYVSGEPECMTAFPLSPEAGKTRVVTVVVGMGGAWFIDAARMAKRGAALAALCDVLTATGRSVEIYGEWIAASPGDNSKFVSTLVKVKAADQPMDLDNLMYALAHPAFYRRAVFSVWERQSKRDVEFIGAGCGGHGYGMNTTAARYVRCGEMVGATVTIRKMVNDHPDKLETDPAGWIVDVLEAVAADETVNV